MATNNSTVMNGFGSTTTQDQIYHYPFLARGHIEKANDDGTYDVNVTLVNPNGYGSNSAVVRCVYADLFGGYGDFTKIKPRTGKIKTKTHLCEGYAVYVLFLNGYTNNGVIIGGSTPNVKSRTGFDFGFEFNGVRFEINNEGELKLTVKGKTTSSGKVVSGSENGTNIVIDKNGNLTINTEAKGDFIVNSSNNGKISANNGTLDLYSFDKTTISASGVNIGSSTAVDALIKGTTYRKAETAMNNAVGSACAGPVGALSALTGAMSPFMSNGTLATPPGWAACAVPLYQLMMALTTYFGTVSSAITTFEIGSTTYLSNKNKTD